MLNQEGNEGLKIISQRILNEKLFIDCEVVPNKVYELEIINREMIGSITGADLIDDTLMFCVPGENDIKIDHEIIIQMK